MVTLYPTRVSLDPHYLCDDCSEFKDGIPEWLNGKPRSYWPNSYVFRVVCVKCGTVITGV